MRDNRNFSQNKGSGQPATPKKESESEVFLKNNIPEILNFEQTEKLNDLLNHLKKYVEEKGKGITTSQLRNIFSKIKNSQRKTAQSLQLIRPQLAYVAARQDNAEAKDIVNFLEEIIKGVSKDEEVKNFTAFFEAIVAYHKLHHGKKS